MQFSPLAAISNFYLINVSGGTATYWFHFLINHFLNLLIYFGLFSLTWLIELDNNKQFHLNRVV